ncbi:MAG: PatB family C-S lyase [Synergistaceae bacterium]|jgi:cystathionine beta-lyase|nr:PatB family C-S lyase [Synergistaceae bacterium]
MQYDFDEVIDRSGTNAMNVEGFRQYIFHDEAIEFPCKDDELTRMWVADMEFAVPDVITDALRKRLDRRIFGYTKIFDPEYCNAFASWTQRHYDWRFDREKLVTSPGIIPALFELVGHICKRDEKVLIMTPSYAYFKHAADFNRRKLVCSDLRNDDGHYTMDFDDLRKKAADEKTVLCVFCSPHNPTGRVWTEEELKTFGHICIENNLWIISDEIHCDLLRVGKRHIPLAKLFPDYSRLVTCMAPSKTFNLAGFMLSNIIISDEGLRATWKARHYDFENPLSIAAAQAAYTHGDEWLEQLKIYLDGNFARTRSYLKEHLPEARFRTAEATYLAWVDVGAYLKDRRNVFLPRLFAEKAGVLLEGGNMFVSNSEGCIRLNLACPRAMLETGLERICAFLRDEGSPRR